jgi:RNA polymerase sigma-70 factor (ECF subfamily)
MLDDIEPGTLHKVAEQSVHGSSEDWSQRPDEQFQSEELRRHIQTAVDALPDGLRTVFLVRDVEGLSTEQIGLSLPAVKTRLHRARLALREAIGQYFAP